MKVSKEIRLNLLHLGVVFPEETSVVVKSVEDGIKKAKKMAKETRFYGFYFSEREYITYKGKRYWCEDKAPDMSATYLITDQIFNHDDVVKLNNPTLRFNMEANGYKYIIKTVLGNYQPYINEKATILMDKDFNIIKP